jgi:choline dehydrogenase-like flavoprotein
MGIDAARSVVDGRFAVHGLDGLDVVDASIIPEPTAGFPQIITIMLAERAAARLLWRFAPVPAASLDS